MAPTPVLSPGESHGWRSLVGCSPRGRKESDTTERRHFHFHLYAYLEVNALSPSWNSIWILASQDSPGGSGVKTLPTVQVWSLGGEDPLEKGMATHSRILAWRIPWTEEPGGPRSLGSQRVGLKWVTEHTHTSASCQTARIYMKSNQHNSSSDFQI